MSEVRWQGDAWLAKMVPAFNAGITEVGHVMADTAVVKMGSDGSPSAPYGYPGVDSGNLRNSIAYVSPDTAGTPLKGGWGTSLLYGRHLEYGGFIWAKNVKYLPIPVDRQLAMTMRRKVQGNLSNGLFGTAGWGSVRAIPGLKYIPPRRGANNGGRLVLASSVRVHVRGTGKSRTAPPMTTVFVLKDHVFIAARPWVMASTNAAVPVALPAFTVAARNLAKQGGLVQ